MYLFIVSAFREIREGSVVKFADGGGEVDRVEGEDLSVLLTPLGANNVNQFRWDDQEDVVTFTRADGPRHGGDPAGFMVYSIKTVVLKERDQNIFNLVVGV